MLTMRKNLPAFGILLYLLLKKSEKRRMVTDLRAITKVIGPMGPLQSEIPLPSMLPKGWPLIVIDLKDCFFTVPLQEKDREKFAFRCLLKIILRLLGNTSGLFNHRECSVSAILYISYWK